MLLKLSSKTERIRSLAFCFCAESRCFCSVPLTCPALKCVECRVEWKMDKQSDPRWQVPMKTSLILFITSISIVYAFQCALCLACCELRSVERPCRGEEGTKVN